MGLANYFTCMNDAELAHHYFCLIKFWTSVCWHYPRDQYKQVLAQNIGQLVQIYRKR